MGGTQRQSGEGTSLNEHLERALQHCEDSDTSFHLREALQLLNCRETRRSSE